MDYRSLDGCMLRAHGQNPAEMPWATKMAYCFNGELRLGGLDLRCRVSEAIRERTNRSSAVTIWDQNHLGSDLMLAEQEAAWCAIASAAMSSS